MFGLKFAFHYMNSRLRSNQLKCYSGKLLLIVGSFNANGSVEFEIKKYINWQLANQTITFRIEDDSNQSGIYERIWITTKK